MKRLWAAVAIAVALLISCFWGIHTISDYTDTMSSSLDSLSAYMDAGDRENAIRLSKELDKQWHHMHNVLSTYTSHNNLEQIDQTLAVITASVANNDQNAFQQEYSRAKAQIFHLQDIELPTFYNIL